MSTAYQIVVCGSIVPDPLQTLEPVAHGAPGLPHGRFWLRTGQNARSGYRLVPCMSRLGAGTKHLCPRTGRPGRRTEGFFPRTDRLVPRTEGFALRTDGFGPRTDEFGRCRDRLKRCQGRLVRRTDDLEPRTDDSKGCRDNVIGRREENDSFRDGPEARRDNSFAPFRGQPESL